MNLRVTIPFDEIESIYGVPNECLRGYDTGMPTATMQSIASMGSRSKPWLSSLAAQILPRTEDRLDYAVYGYYPDRWYRMEGIWAD